MPAPRAYTSHELVAHRGDLTIYGQLYLPGTYSGTQSLPTLACAHGLGSNYLHTVSYAWDLAARGFAVYCFDFCGGGYASRSTGNPINMSLATERDDIVCVLRMLAQRPEVDASRLYLLGEGQGGFAATMALHDNPTLAQALVLLYPAFHLHDEARRTFPTPKNVPVSYRQRGMRVGRSYGQVAWETNPYTQMRGYTGDVLIVHGDEDAVCPIEYSERAVEVFPHAQLVVIHGGKHTFREKALEKSVQTVRDFLEEKASSSQETPATEPNPREDDGEQQVKPDSTNPKHPTESATTGAQDSIAIDTPKRPAETATAEAESAAVAQTSKPATETENDADVNTPEQAPTETVAPTAPTPKEGAEEERFRGAHFATSTRTINSQDIRGRHSVHKTRRASSGRHFRS